MHAKPEALRAGAGAGRPGSGRSADGSDDPGPECGSLWPFSGRAMEGATAIGVMSIFEIWGFGRPMRRSGVLGHGVGSDDPSRRRNIRSHASTGWLR